MTPVHACGWRVQASFKLILSVSVGIAGGDACAQQAPWDDYSVHIQRAENSQALNGDLFGDSVDLYTGRVSFSTTDIDLKGNSALPVALTRHFEIRDPRLHGSAPFMDWTLELPRISGVFGHEFSGPVTYSVHGWADQRCSGARAPEPIELTYFATEFWYGLHASIPNGGELLEPSANAQQPTAGGPYPWVSSQFTWFSCLPAVQNSTGEGFLAITPEGHRYWFDWMAAEEEPQLEKWVPWSLAGQPDTYIAATLTRRRHTLYATRVEDRFGNWVTYSYSNAADAPVRLSSIESNDGRRIDIDSDAAGRISAAHAGSRTWTYAYQDGPGTLGGLQAVTLPDGSQWMLDLSAFRSLLPPLMADDATCSFPAYAADRDHASEPTVATMRHPSGASALFQVDARLHGRSNVPQRCVATGEGLVGVPEVGTYSDFVRMYWTTSLVQKQITGPGLPAMTWSYDYMNAFKAEDMPALAATAPQPIPVGSWASSLSPSGDPVCVSDDCAGTVATEVHGPDGVWSRYTYGNSHRYNEGQLLKLDIGTGPDAILRTERYAYDNATSGRPYPTPVGHSLQYQGDGVTNTYLRPMREAVIEQDGSRYVRRINAFDMFARPTDETQERSPL